MFVIGRIAKSCEVEQMVVANSTEKLHFLSVRKVQVILMPCLTLPTAKSGWTCDHLTQNSVFSAE